MNDKEKKRKEAMQQATDKAHVKRGRETRAKIREAVDEAAKKREEEEGKK